MKIRYIGSSYNDKLNLNFGDIVTVIAVSNNTNNICLIFDNNIIITYTLDEFTKNWSSPNIF